MSRRREAGAEHPGLRWGPFTCRVPLYHTRVEWPELAQGIFVSAATGLALVPILTTHFGLTFEEAVAFVFIEALLISAAPIIFGEPFAPGWITPALPLILAFLVPAGGARFSTPAEGFQYMAAVSLEFAAIVFFMGFSGLGRRVIDWLPNAFKGGIVMGAALAALYRVFITDESLLRAQPVSTTVALSACLILIFSLPVRRYKARYRWLAVVASLGLLPGFLAAALVGPFVGLVPRPVQWLVDLGLLPANWGSWALEFFKTEIIFDVEWGILLPPFSDLFAKVSPFSIGWPSWMQFLDVLPLAFMGYVILFGDLITGIEVLKSGMASRPDEKININISRTHSSIGIRNVLMAVVAPFFPTQGTLWTGVHVIIVQRWAEGRQAVDSLFSGIASYYVFGFGVPVVYMALPLVTALKPLLHIALSLTLVLTGFACAYVAVGLQRTQIERGVVVLNGVALAVFNPWVGMMVAVIATLTLIGFRNPESSAR